MEASSYVTPAYTIIEEPVLALRNRTLLNAQIIKGDKRKKQMTEGEQG